ncbi:RING finger protein 223-like isoform X2 [Hypanus sabinus]|uniref:RING finger protein 223-like isoform X2 n=1 Tax=Hypanus sabinus TaxID=79690 RepID=UPI0028C3F060|nr:RING finger protein 223-like isoform X2 [Hypanus sabinus]
MFGDAECSVCYSPYNGGSRTPRVLPCQHAFCSECVLILLAQSHPDVSGEHQLACPLCRHLSRVRWDGRSIPYPGVWEGPQEEEMRSSVADALKRRAKGWTRGLKRLWGQRTPGTDGIAGGTGQVRQHLWK